MPCKRRELSTNFITKKGWFKSVLNDHSLGWLVTLQKHYSQTCGNGLWCFIACIFIWLLTFWYISSPFSHHPLHHQCKQFEQRNSTVSGEKSLGFMPGYFSHYTWSIFEEGSPILGQASSTVLIIQTCICEVTITSFKSAPRTTSTQKQDNPPTSWGRNYSGLHKDRHWHLHSWCFTQLVHLFQKLLKITEVVDPLMPCFIHADYQPKVLHFMTWTLTAFSECI